MQGYSRILAQAIACLPMLFYALHPVFSHASTHIKKNSVKVSDDNMSCLGLTVWWSIGWPSSGGWLENVWSPDKTDWHTSAQINK